MSAEPGFLVAPSISSFFFVAILEAFLKPCLNISGHFHSTLGN